MSADVGTVFLSTDEHAETISYTPVGGSATSYPAIVFREEDVDAMPFSDGMIRKTAVRIMLGTSGSYGPATVTEGDSVTLDSEAYKVVGRPDRDGFGMQTLKLTRIEVREKHAVEGTRIKR